MRKQLSSLLGLVLAVSCFSCVVSWDDWEGDTTFTTSQHSDEIQGVESLVANLELGFGKLEIEAGTSGRLYDLDLYYDENALEPELNLDRQGKNATLDFSFKGKSRWGRRIGNTRASLRVNPGIKFRLRAETGVTASEINLSGMTVESLDLEAGVGETSIQVASRNRTRCREIQIRNGVGTLEAVGLGNLRFEKLAFEGGVGAAELDFSGEWEDDAEVEIEVGVGGIEIRLPRDLGAEVRMSGSFLSGIDLSGFRKEGNTYYSDNLDRVSHVVRIRIRAGIGGVSIEWT